MKNKNNERKITYNGNLFQLVSCIGYSEKNNRIKIFEIAHRPPGVRMLFKKDNLILLTKEFRPEIEDWDFRLPGGKVFDDFISYEKCLKNEIELNNKIKAAVILEAKQETGMVVSSNNINLFHKSVAGASVIWDLYYFEITRFEESLDGQDLEEGEQIEKPVWKTFDEVKEMCLDGKIKEDRSVAVLLKYILTRNP